jgi:hypothetical protein
MLTPCSELQRFSLASSLGLSHFYVFLPKMLYVGDGVAPDKKEAMTYFKKAGF